MSQNELRILFAKPLQLDGFAKSHLPPHDDMIQKSGHLETRSQLRPGLDRIWGKVQKK